MIDWDGAIIALISAIIGALLGSFIPVWINWLQRPRLVMSCDMSHKTEEYSRFMTFWIHILNIGKKSAKKCNIHFKFQDKNTITFIEGRQVLRSDASSPDETIHPKQIDNRQIAFVNLKEGTIGNFGCGSVPLSTVEFPVKVIVSLTAIDTEPVTNTFIIQKDDQSFRFKKESRLFHLGNNAIELDN